MPGPWAKFSSSVWSDAHANALDGHDTGMLIPHLSPIMDFANSLQNIHTTGRQGNFRYNNMDQSVEMGRKVGIELATGKSTGHAAVATGQEYFG